MQGKGENPDLLLLGGLAKVEMLEGESTEMQLESQCMHNNYAVAPQRRNVTDPPLLIRRSSYRS